MVLIIFALSISALAGCRTFQALLEPSKLQYDYNWERAVKDLESEMIAQRKVDQKSKSLKSNDPAWGNIRKLQVDTSKPLALVELIDIGLRNNPKTRQAWESTRLALAQEKQAESALYPQATATMSLNREKIISNSNSGDADNSNYGPDLKVTYLLLDFGGRGAKIDEMSQMLVSENSKYNKSIQDMLLQVEKYYYELHSAQSDVEAKLADVENTKVDYEAAQVRFSSGLSTKLDVLEAKANYDDALYNLEGAKGDLKTARANLAQAVGLPADTKFEIAPPVGEIPTDIKEEDVTELIEEALKKRPDIASRLAQLKAKKAALKSANSDLWPTLNFAGETYRNEYDYYKFNRQRNYDYEYTGTLSLEWDIFDGFNTIYKKRAAERQVDIEYNQLVQDELAASSDVWIKYYNFNTAVEKLKYSRAFLDSASESYALAFESYNNGLKSILDLLQSQSKLSDARSKLINSKKDVFVGLVELAHSTGSLYVKSMPSKTGG
ncbi:MAG: TolC family protein [Candidatus Omnitrophota bacterium]